MDIPDLTVLELGRKVQIGEVTAIEIARAALKQVHTWETSIHAYVTVDEKGTLKRVTAVQAKIRDGALTGPPADVPMTVEDSTCTKGLRTIYSLSILRDFIPIYTAQAVSNPGQAGAVTLGKTNMGGFVTGSTIETSAFGVTRNSRGTGHVSEESSDSFYVAAAAGECFYALGSDTGESVRQPGSFCDVAGIKPTYGTVSRYGLVAYGSSLDQIGPVARDVVDYAAILEILVLHDTKDSTSLERKGCDFTAALKEDVKGVRIGTPEPYLGQGLDRKVRDAVLRAVDVLKEKGAVVEAFDLQLVDYAIPAYYVVVSAETNSDLSRFDGAKYGYRTPEYEGLHNTYKKGCPEGFGPEIRRCIMLKSFILNSGYYDTYYLKALRTKALTKEEFDQALPGYGMVLAPTPPGTAPRLGESPKGPLKMYLRSIYTISVSLVGFPGITAPCRMDLKELPIGLQLIEDCSKEKSIIHAAYAYKSTRGFTAPSLTAGGVREEGTL